MSAASAQKGYRLGTHRTVDPARTVQRARIVANRIGVTRLANLTRLDRIDIPVFSTIRPGSRSLSVSQGKGVTPTEARASALMETIEYWHAETARPAGPATQLADLAPDATPIDIDRLPRPRSAGSTPFPADRPILWSRGVDVVTSASVWIPFDAVTLDKVGLDYEATAFKVSSNGLASGNTRDEAILHGLCELVERDSVTRWWLAITERAAITETRIDIGTVESTAVLQLLAKVDRAGIDVALWDITSPIGVPAFQCCMLDRTDAAPWRISGAAWGHGCHASREAAALRSITEAAQTRATIIAGTRDDNLRRHYAMQNDPERAREVRELLLATPCSRSMLDVESVETDTISDDLGVVLRRLRAAGLHQVASVDLTRIEHGIPVLKVIVPGLETSVLHRGFSSQAA